MSQTEEQLSKFTEDGKSIFVFYKGKKMGLVNDKKLSNQELEIILEKAKEIILSLN